MNGPHNITKRALGWQLDSWMQHNSDFSFSILYLPHLAVQLKDNDMRLFKEITWIISKAPESEVPKAFRNSSLAYISTGRKTSCLCLVRKENNFCTASLNPSPRTPATCPGTNNPTVGSQDEGSAYKKAFRCVMKNKQVKSGAPRRSL